MTLAHQILKLPAPKVAELHSVMTEAALVAYSGGDHAAVFRRAKNRKVGMQRRVLALLETTTIAQVENMAAILTDHLG
jgi:hypothetical protein